MDNITKAKINLFAVLRNLEDLCAMDKESADIIKDTKLSVQFNVPDVGSATIDFDHGKCTFNRGKKHAGLQLFFTSAEHFNNLIDPPKDANGKPKTVIPIFLQRIQSRIPSQSIHETRRQALVLSATGGGQEGGTSERSRIFQNQHDAHAVHRVVRTLRSRKQR
ncbi:MAG: hypothetical protein L6V85_02040 [Clostridiales bacterium]|nr:MAG: hypothetical protein L6V85_02040 [Clostridiales bacterium]